MVLYRNSGMALHPITSTGVALYRTSGMTLYRNSGMALHPITSTGVALFMHQAQSLSMAQCGQRRLNQMRRFPSVINNISLLWTPLLETSNTLRMWMGQNRVLRELLHLDSPVDGYWIIVNIIRPLGYDRVYVLLWKVADTPFHIQGDELRWSRVSFCNYLK